MQRKREKEEIAKGEEVPLVFEGNIEEISVGAMTEIVREQMRQVCYE